MTHPNATVAGSTTGAGVLIVWLLGNVLHLDISAELGAAIAGAAATVLLFVGRNGVCGAWNRIWRGPAGSG